MSDKKDKAGWYDEKGKAGWYDKKDNNDKEGFYPDKKDKKKDKK